MLNKIYIIIIILLSFSVISCGKDSLIRNENAGQDSIQEDSTSHISENGSHQGTETGNGMSLALSFSGYSSTEDVSLDSQGEQSQGLRNEPYRDHAVLIQTSTFTIHTALLVVEKIGFMPADRCEADTFHGHGTERVDLEGPFIINLLTQTSTPSLDTITLPEGEYCGIGMMLRKFDPMKMKHHLPKNHPVLNHSMYIAGTVNDRVPFILTADFNRPFLLFNENQSLGAESLKDSLLEIGFDLGKWFDGITTAHIKQMPIHGTLTAVINKKNNFYIFRQIVKNIYESTSLFADKNHNGRLDPEERQHQMGLAHGHFDENMDIEHDDE